MKHRLLLASVLSVALAACGGGGGGSSSTTDPETDTGTGDDGGISTGVIDENTSNTSYAQAAQAACGDQPLEPSVTDVFNSSGKRRISPAGESGDVYVQSSTGTLCIEGNFFMLHMDGFQGDVYIQGQVENVQLLDAQLTKVYAFNGVEYVYVSSGVDATLYASRVGSWDDDSNSNSVRPLSDAQF